MESETTKKENELGRVKLLLEKQSKANILKKKKRKSERSSYKSGTKKRNKTQKKLKPLRIRNYAEEILLNHVQDPKTRQMLDKKINGEFISFSSNTFYTNF